MRLLLDTHAVAWWFEDSSKLGRAAHAAISEGDTLVLVSAVSIFEMTLKYRLGKWPEIADLLGNLDGYLRGQRFDTLSLTPQHAEIAGNLDIPHRDPFDRMLIAQAQVEKAQLVSNEALFDGFGVNRLW